MSCQCTKRNIKTFLKATNVLVNCRYLEKYSRKYFSKIYLATFTKINFLQNVNLDFYPVILASHDINYSFDCDWTIDVRGVFLDISKAFGKVWHDGIIFKLETYGVKGKLLNLIKNILNARYQRVVLNDQHAAWELVKSGLPHRLYSVHLCF